MKTLNVILHGLIGLIVEDGTLAIAILAVVVAAAISAALMPGFPLAAGAILVLGCLGVLLVNVRLARVDESGTGEG